MASAPPSTPRAWGPLRTLLALAPTLLVVPLVLRAYYALPTPLAAPFDAAGRSQLSEATMLGYAKYLSEDIGYRTVGTPEHAAADAWMVQKAEELKAECDARVQKTGRKLECEVWHQRGTGSHRFDMMGKRLYKAYADLTNIVLRISDGTPAGKAHALLLNSHVDSTLPSPGAADDALPVGAMIECARVLIQDDEWTPAHAVVFLWNNAEESLQDGSHLFSTQHPIAPTIRAVINLEAAGTTGPELLFQATSEEMIRAYAKVPYPLGTVVATDTFKTGVMLSDTDFRQFVQYLNVTGLDMAIVGNSYLYHMRNDLVENIEPGVAQHMASNALSLIRTLTALDSDLSSLAPPSAEHPDASGPSPPSSVFFSYLGAFILVPLRSARLTAAFLLLAGADLALRRGAVPDPAPALRGGSSMRIAKAVGAGHTAEWAGAHP